MKKTRAGRRIGSPSGSRFYVLHSHSAFWISAARPRDEDAAGAPAEVPVERRVFEEFL